MSEYRHHYVVCAIAKNEDTYLEEWVKYHIGIGFDHIFLYDNDSVNYIEDLFQKSSLNDKVTVIRWPTYSGESSQVSAYRHFLNTYGKQVEWTAVIDIDEFINLKQDATIAQFISRFPGADGIGINWRIFGSAGHKHYSPTFVTERFRFASEIGFDANKLRKSIYRMTSVKIIDIHSGTYKDNAAIYSPNGTGINGDVVIPVDRSNYEVAQINHYFVKSYEEWKKKVKRGYTDGTIRDIETFHIFDRNEVEDNTILL